MASLRTWSFIERCSSTDACWRSHPPQPSATLGQTGSTRDGDVTIDGKSVSLTELVAQLTSARKQYAELGVLVRGDGSGEFQRVAEVLNACKQAGIAELAISVKADSQRK